MGGREENRIAFKPGEHSQKSKHPELWEVCAGRALLSSLFHAMHVLWRKYVSHACEASFRAWEEGGLVEIGARTREEKSQQGHLGEPPREALGNERLLSISNVQVLAVAGFWGQGTLSEAV